MTPGNNWFGNEGSMLWGVLRNLPFIAIGGMIVCLYFKVRQEDGASDTWNADAAENDLLCSYADLVYQETEPYIDRREI